MVKKLIINADDFGLSDGVTYGILKAHNDGVLTSTTCMMNMPHIEKYLELTKDYPNLGLGVHLNITLGPALTKNSFIDENGYFQSRDCYKDRKPIVNKDELYKEWKMQIDKFIDITGQKPSHLDSHHHVHLLPGNIDVALKLAKEYDLPIREENHIQTDYEFVKFSEDFYDETVSLDTIKKICHYEYDIFEIMCHPAFVDWYLYNHSSYHLKRTEELDILCSNEIKEFISAFQLINYKQIKKVI